MLCVMSAFATLHRISEQEKIMSVRRMLLSVAFFSAIAIFVQAQDQKPVIKHAPAPVTSPASGKEMFNAYCATCHGTDGKGNGPAAAALKSPPADLTMLAKNNGGKYPSAKVTAVLRGEATLVAHGTQEMPVWGPVFWRMSQGHESEMQQRIANLTKYIESLQAK
jgi:mono/diheme cytochrome c family protein